MRRSTKILLETFLAGSLAFAVAACGSDDTLPGTNMCAAACNGDQICINGTCQSAFGQFYTITIDSIHFAERDGNGACWDEPGCGNPDPQIEIELNGHTVGEIDEDDDTFDATYGATYDIFLDASGSRLTIELVDEDTIDANDSAVTCTFDPISAENLRNKDLSCTQLGNSIDASIAIRGEIP